MKFLILAFLLVSSKTFAGSWSYDCRKWKEGKEPKGKSQFFVKDEGSEGFFNVTGRFFISETDKSPILFLKDKDVLVSVSGTDGFSFKPIANGDLDVGTAALLAGIAELSKGSWTIAKGGQRVFRIEVLEPASKFMAISCEQGEPCAAVDRAAKKKYTMEQDPDVVENAKKHFEAASLRPAIDRACELLQDEVIDRDISKFENACKRRSKLKLPDKLRRQELCEEAKLTLKAFMEPKPSIF